MAYIDDIYAVVQIAPTGVPTYVRLSQNENGRRMYFAIVGGTIPAGSTATVSGTKPDGVVYSASGTITGNTVLINEDVQLSAVAGQWDAKLKIINSGQTIATGRIRFVIDGDTVAPGSVPSDSQLEGLVAEAQSYAEAAMNAAYYGSPLKASTVAGMTDHTRVYVYTGSESGYTNGNWYYWNGTAWTSGGVYNAVAVDTDPSLTIAGKAADARATGNRLTAAETDIDDIKSDLESVLSEDAKTALLNCFRHIPFLDHDADYVGILEAALGSDGFPKITADYNPGTATIYTTDSLNDLKQYLTVKYFVNATDTGTVVSAGSYTLSGTLTAGQSVIGVSYNDCSTTFTATVVDFYNIDTWSMSNGLVSLSHGSAGSYNGTIGINGYSNNLRRVTYTDKGRRPFIYSDTLQDTTMYPIPVPSDATTATVTITPSSMYVGVGIWQFNPNTNNYTQVTSVGWAQSTASISFTAGENLFCAVNIKKDSSGNAFTAEPSDVVIQYT